MSMFVKGSTGWYVLCTDVQLGNGSGAKIGLGPCLYQPWSVLGAEGESFHEDQDGACKDPILCWFNGSSLMASNNLTFHVTLSDVMN